jgi:late competence protein required for DNA uptake (superfamily II DNA/RNA helicase)
VKPLAEEVEGGHAVGTDKGKKRKQPPQPTLEIEHLSDQLQGENVSLKRCKQEFIEEDHAALQQHISAVEAVAQCSICSDTMKQASTVSGCGHTFCRSCIEEAVRVNGCCPLCHQPA